MKKLMLSATMVAMMVTATAAPAFASHEDDFEGGDVDQTGGSLRANNSLVQQCQNFFNIQNQVAAEVDQDQDVQQSANQTITVEDAEDVDIDAELNQSAEQTADIAGVDVEDVNLVCNQALAQGSSASAMAMTGGSSSSSGGSSSSSSGGSSSSSSGGSSSSSSGGDVDQTGGSLSASNSIVQQGQNFFNVQNQVAAEVEQDQNVNQQATQTITVEGAEDVDIDAELNQSAEQNANVGNVNIQDVHLSTAQAIAVSR